MNHISENNDVGSDSSSEDFQEGPGKKIKAKKY
jgi:hypothetical protein